ncbi:MAG TPA: 4'-phosphopantetheinyl transferase superfamily protein, partial [Solirubrobacteraceae bacterium]|nr:4'-phosphopantetheinyl transferase superfamily protein [Solirubrobacteraceae bacterium]
AGPPGLAAGEAHVWRARVSAIPPGFEELLDAREHARARTILDRARAARYARCRGLLRVLLAGYTASDAAQLAFVGDAHGKPRLRGGRRPEFNVSHSGTTMLLAFSAAGAVGVDVEELRSVRDPLALARRMLGESAVRELRALDPAARERAFLRSWVHHEARVKCSGAGLALHERGRAAASTGRAGGPEPWCEELELGPRALGAIALARAPRALALYDWRAP